MTVCTNLRKNKALWKEDPSPSSAFPDLPSRSSTADFPALPTSSGTNRMSRNQVRELAFGAKSARPVSDPVVANAYRKKEEEEDAPPKKGKKKKNKNDARDLVLNFAQ
jgi:hypothetical protein